jgi:hypothetical protein
MRSAVDRRDWAGLEAEFEDALERVDRNAAQAIGSVDLDDYASFLRASLEAIATRVDPEAAAVYWEFNPDNQWKSAFFACRSYRPEESGDDDWAADFDESETIAGPSPEPSRLSAEQATVGPCRSRGAPDITIRQWFSESGLDSRLLAATVRSTVVEW